MKLKMVALDLDGTLLGENNSVSEVNKNALRSLSNKGIEIVLCTGRMRSCTIPIVTQLGIDCAIVTYNGSLAEGKESDQRECYHSSHIRGEDVKSILQFSSENGFSTNFYQDEKILTISENANQKKQIERYRKMTNANFEVIESYYPKIKGLISPKLAVLTSEEKLDESYKKAVEKFGKELHLIKMDFYIEFMVKGDSKAKALSAIVKKNGFKSEEVVAFGDGRNDIELLKYVGFGIAMDNAFKECKDSADKVSKWKNTEDGVAKELELLVNSGSFEFKQI